MTQIVTNAIKALLYEVVTLPKPGLVDPSDIGPHPDMDVYMFINSSLSLREYFNKAEEIGITYETDLKKVFEQLRIQGRIAEKIRFHTTSGVNTHKGAIFSLGIFVCAESYARFNNVDTFSVIRKMCQGLVKNDLQKNNQNLTAGEQQFIQYGQGGARQVAQEGYPIIEKIALPFLKNRQGTTNQRLLDTLMKIATVIEDSNLIKRAGNIEVINWLHQSAEKYLRLGGAETKTGLAYLDELNKVFKENNYSLGGCADLLIVTIFMALEKGYL